MSMICGGDGENPNGNSGIDEIDAKYRNGLMNTSAYISKLKEFNLSVDEIRAKVEENRPNRLWETRNDCD